MPNPIPISQGSPSTAEAMLAAAQTTAWIALIAAIMSFVGILLTAIIARRNGFVQARTTQQIKHAEFRQKWIDELRTEMANFTKFAVTKGDLSETLPELLATMNLIMMRMDREDPDHDYLFDLMQSILRPDPKLSEEEKATQKGNRSLGS